MCLNIDNVKSYLKNKPLSISVSRNNNTTVYKVNGKIFAILSEDIYPHIILKNEPLLNKALRKKFNFIFPASNILNKTYWNTIILIDGLDDEVLFKMIDKSYELSVETMTKRQKAHYHYEISDLA